MQLTNKPNSWLWSGLLQSVSCHCSLFCSSLDFKATQVLLVPSNTAFERTTRPFLILGMTKGLSCTKRQPEVSHSFSKETNPISHCNIDRLKKKSVWIVEIQQARKEYFFLLTLPKLLCVSKKCWSRQSNTKNSNMVLQHSVSASATFRFNRDSV